MWNFTSMRGKQGVGINPSFAISVKTVIPGGWGLALACLLCSLIWAAEPALPAAAQSETPAAADTPPAASNTPAAEPAAPQANPAPAGVAAGPLPHPFPRRIKAPSLNIGAQWLNTAEPLDIRDLRGKFVLLDFWTYCCINCLHILPELKKLEQAYPGELVVIGVHSAKFDTEQDTANIREAILRYNIEHPVVNDAEHKIWDTYFVNSWPSLRIIDPEGNLVGVHSGEVDFESLDQFLKTALPYYEQNKLLDKKPLNFALEASKAAKTPLRFPGKILADAPGGRLFIADSNHHRIIVTDLTGKLLQIIGKGVAGRDDGNFSLATFQNPQGLDLRDNTLYVADTDNHLLRKIDLAQQTVTTIAGDGRQSHLPWPGLTEEMLLSPFAKLPERFVGPPLKTSLNSPWDVKLVGTDLLIAMAGPHQIWRMPLDQSEIGPYAGSGREHLSDGALLPERPFQRGSSAFAQPSGLAILGQELFVADSEGSAIRGVPLPDNPQGKVRTIVGAANQPDALFVFGDVDGPVEKARLQHCLGVAADQNQLFVADTYNNKIKQIDLTAKSITTLAGTGKPGKTDGKLAEFDEPAGLAVAAGKVYVADTNNHLIRVIDLADGTTGTLAIAGLQPPAPVMEAANPPKKPKFRNPQQIKLEAVTVKPVEGQLELKVQLTLPTDWKINNLAPAIYYVEVEGETGPVDRTVLGEAGKNTEGMETFVIPLKLAADMGQDTVKVSLNYYICKGGPEGICTTGSVEWTASIKVTPDGKDAIVPLPATVEEPK
ncbi:MAG: thioredoxin-like domain-containing protein [Pirellulales bacterium]|nr:thioredoxin-like domain-containing protein [Pirellulales bacterium]